MSETCAPARLGEGDRAREAACDRAGARARARAAARANEGHGERIMAWKAPGCSEGDVDEGDGGGQDAQEGSKLRSTAE